MSFRLLIKALLRQDHGTQASEDQLVNIVQALNHMCNEYERSNSNADARDENARIHLRMMEVDDEASSHSNEGGIQSQDNGTSTLHPYEVLMQTWQNQEIDPITEHQQEVLMHNWLNGIPNPKHTGPPWTLEYLAYVEEVAHMILSVELLVGPVHPVMSYDESDLNMPGGVAGSTAENPNTC